MEQHFRQFVSDQEALRKQVADTVAELAAERQAKESLERDLEDMKRDRKESRRKYNGLKITYRTDFEAYEKTVAAAKEESAQQIYTLGQNAHAERSELRARHAAEIRHLQQQLGAANDKVKGQTSAIAALQRQHDLLVRQHSEQGNKMKESAADLQRARTETSSAATRLQERELQHAARIKALEAQHAADARALATEHEAKVIEMERHHQEALTVLRMTHTSAIADLKASHTAEVGTLEAHKAALETENLNLRAELAKIGSNLANAEAEMERLAANLAAATADGDTRSRTNAALEYDISKLREDMSATNARLADAQEERNSATQDHERLIATHNNLQTAQDCLTAAYDHLSEEHLHLLNDYAALETNSDEIIAILGEMVVYQEEETADALRQLQEMSASHADDLAEAERKAQRAEMDERRVREAREYFANVQRTIVALDSKANKLKKKISAQGDIRSRGSRDRKSNVSPFNLDPRTPTKDDAQRTLSWHMGQGGIGHSAHHGTPTRAFNLGSEVGVPQPPARLGTVTPRNALPTKRRRDAFSQSDVDLEEDESRARVRRP